MQTNIYADSFQRIDFCKDTKIIIMSWLPGTKEMNYSQFQGCIHIFSGFALQKQAHGVLIDGTQMKMTGLQMEVMFKWRAENIAPNYNQAGVKKLAFLHQSPSDVPYVEEKTMPSDNFPTKHFASKEDAITWLKS